MDPFQIFTKRIRNRPLTIIMNDGISVSVLILYASDDANVTGSLRQVWRGDGIIGSRPTLPIAHHTRDIEILKELATTIPASINPLLDDNIIIMTANAEMVWTLDTDRARLAEYLPYLILTLGMLFKDPGNNSAARIWSALVTDKIWDMIRST